MIRQAMLLAAGLGSRMRPLTERTAKPLLPLGGRPLIDHALDRLLQAGVSHVVVNTHWQSDLVQRHLERRQGGPATTVRLQAARAGDRFHADVGRGDFTLDTWGHLRRRLEREVAPYLFAGVQVATPALFSNAPAPPFSANVMWDRAIAAGRLRAVVHDGLWFHLSRPSDLSDAEVALHANATGESR